MSAAELAAFLDEERTVICATIGQDGFPHLMPLWYVMRDADLWAWTFAKSQKVRNLERDPRATLQVEAGSEYAELRGAMLKCDVTRASRHRARRRVRPRALRALPAGAPRSGELDDDVRAMVLAQAPKRVALQFTRPLERHLGSPQARRRGLLVR